LRRPIDTTGAPRRSLPRWFRPRLLHLAPLLDELGAVVGAAEAVANGIGKLRLDSAALIVFLLIARS
jgi:hypothetical protein